MGASSMAGLRPGTWREVPCSTGARVHSRLPQPAPAGEHAISLSLPRSNGATQSGDAIIASTMQFPLSIIYCICCTGRRGKRQDRFFDRREGQTTRRAAGREPERGVSPGIPRAPRPPRASPAGAGATGGSGRRCRSPARQSRLRAAWIEPPRPAARLQKVTGVTLPEGASLISNACYYLDCILNRQTTERSARERYLNGSGLLNTRRSKPISRGGRADRHPPPRLSPPLPARPGPSAPCPPLGGRRGSGGRAGRAGRGRWRGRGGGAEALSGAARGGAVPAAAAAAGRRRPGGGRSGSAERRRGREAPVGRRGWGSRLRCPPAPHKALMRHLSRRLCCWGGGRRPVGLGARERM